MRTRLRDDEAVTLSLRRGSFSAAKRLGERLRGVDPFPQAYELLNLSESTFDEAVDVFERDDDQGLSFTDAATIAAVRRHDLDGVVRFDDDFDGHVERFDPATL